MTSILEATTRLESPTAANCGWRVLRVLIGILILASAAAKWHQLATSPSFGDGILHARWFIILVVEFELLFGIWLLAGLMPKLTWLASLGCFAIFASVSAYKGVTGESSCGCFGAAVINPWHTVTLDLIVIGLLIVLRPSVHRTPGLNAAKQYIVNYCLIAIPLCGFAFWEISQVKFHQLQEVGQVLEQGSVVKLEPQAWIGKEFPLRNHCDIGETITSGHWLVLLHRAGCMDCREASPLIADLVKQKDCSLVVLEMNSNVDSLSFGEVESLTGLMNQEISWFVETPVVLELDNGFVKQVLLREELKRMRSPDLSHVPIFGQVSPKEAKK